MADMNLSGGALAPPSPYPPYLNWVARRDGTGTVTSVMDAHQFTLATSDIATTAFVFPDLSGNRTTLKAGDILKDLGSVVHTYTQLGNPNPIHFGTYRRVQLVAGGDTTGSAAHEAFGIFSEGPWGSASNQYNTFWIRTWTADPQWFRTAAIARLG